MRLAKIKKLISNEKAEFKMQYGMKLTTLMISVVTGIPKHTIDNFANFNDEALEKYYHLFKETDFSFFINKDIFKDHI